MWFVFAFLSSITAAGVAIFGKLGVKNIDSTLATTIRALIMAAFLVAVSLVLKKWNGFSAGSLSSRDWSFIVLAGISGALSWLFYFLALKTGATTKVVAIDRLSLIFAAIMAVIFLGESAGWKLGIGAVLMAAGAIIISLR